MQHQRLHKGLLYLRYIVIAILSLILILAVTAVFAQDKSSSLETKIKPYKDNGMFRKDDKRIGYFIKLKNRNTSTQKGSILIEVKNTYSQLIYKTAVGIEIEPGSAFYKEVDFENPYFRPGFYYVTMAIKTNSWNDTPYYVFAVEPERMQPSTYRPNDFKNFWNQSKTELLSIDPNYQVIRRSDVGTDDNEVYMVEFMSISNTKIRGWLTVPKGRGKFPVIYNLPAYVTSAEPIMRRDAAVFSLDIRGVGNSADLAKITAEKYLIAGIHDRNSYIYKDAYMDCLRGLDFLFSQHDLKIDPTKIIVKGEGQGACLAAVVVALDGRRVKGLIMDRPTLLDVRTLFAVDEAQSQVPWPVNALKEYFSKSKTSENTFFRTWDYFDPLSFASDIKCPVLLGTLLKSTTSPPQCAYNFYNQVLSAKREVYVCAEGENNMDKGYYVFEGNWTREVLRIPN